MSTPDERVEVTPELLQRIEQWPANPKARAVLIADLPAAAVCKALVQRIRELESEREVERMDRHRRDLLLRGH